LRSVAAPVRDHHGRVVAAISASGPAYRLTGERMPELIEWVVQVAASVSQTLGWGGGVARGDDAGDVSE
jgi:DNA-binding IclR family transcriptional regulator